MATLKGFGSLAAIPAEKMTDKITRRVVAGARSDAKNLFTTVSAITGLWGG
jgi:hypothetical protein